MENAGAPEEVNEAGYA
uniref:Uncharacterized protein n=1 Tax=Anguilla anguilla TaxID=7936 RepID=A0A0E9RBT0_ANGAN